MNNKTLGTEFEKFMCEFLSKRGWWVHFIEPKKDGSQPFDIIAVRNGITLAADCKTSASGTFSYLRLEDNQITSFDKWLRCGNNAPKVFVWHEDRVYVLDYLALMHNRTLKIKEQPEITQTIYG